MTFVQYCTYIVRIICIACGNNTVTLSYEADETNKTRSGVITFLLATVSETSSPYSCQAKTESKRFDSVLTWHE